jgi:tetraacyldisaccharide 4'-kinase
MSGPASQSPPLPGPLGVVLSRLYGAVIARINRRYDTGKGVIRFDRPVISVGNLSMGGTGKTPMVAWIVRGLLDAGIRPCIAMRGYKSGGGDSDEAAAYRREFPDVPIVSQPDRAEGLMRLFGQQYEEDQPPVECIVLDDGFQHRRIARDLDLVLIDATRPPFADRLAPAGWLREPVESLERAGFIVVTHAEAVESAAVSEIEQGVAALRGSGVDAVARHAWASLNVTEAEGEVQRSPDWLRGKRTVVVSAIGNPGPFEMAARKAIGREPVHIIRRPDHDPYSGRTAREIAAAAKDAEVILTTEKDWSKLSKMRWEVPVARPRLELRFDRGGEELVGEVLGTVERGAPE